MLSMYVDFIDCLNIQRCVSVSTCTQACLCLFFSENLGEVFDDGCDGCEFKNHYFYYFRKLFVPKGGIVNRTIHYSIV